MAYSLQALVGREEIIRRMAVGVAAATVVDLKADLKLIPLTRDLLNAFPALPTQTDGVPQLTPSLAEWVARSSQDGTLAYLEAEYFGGVGEQTSAVWRQGSMIVGPTTATDAINRALRLLGVVADPGKDEFDTVGLGRHRHTEKWI